MNKQPQPLDGGDRAGPAADRPPARSGLRWGLAVLPLLAAGCAPLGPDFQRPDAPTMENWQTPHSDEVQDIAVAPEELDFASWWQVFEDPILDNLVRTAYSQNLDLRSAGLRILEARAILGIAIGEQYPQTQTLGGSATQNELSQNLRSTRGADFSFKEWQTGFDVAWEMDFWGRFRRGIESADANLYASIADYDDLLVSLTAEVASAYVQVRTFEERIRLALQDIAIQTRSLEIADVRFRNGVVTELDVQQARTLVRNTEAAVPELEIGRRQALNALAVLLGRPPGEVAPMLGDPEASAIPKPNQAVLVDMPANLLRRRPDIRRAEMQAASQSAQIGVAQADLYPNFFIGGNIGLQANTFSDTFESASYTHSIGPSFSWALFNYGRLKNNVRLQDARLQELLVDYDNTVLRAYQEVEDSMIGFVKSQESVGYLEDSVQAASRSVDLALVQYRDGIIDYNRVLTTQEQLVEQQQNWTQRRGDVALNLVGMYKAMGGGWELRVGNDFVTERDVDEMRQRVDWGDLLPEELPENVEELPAPAGERSLFPRPDW
jgi:NodT family efflux transporter outer membrane factor (OMF) lipoprotein